MPKLPVKRNTKMTSAGYLNMARALASPEYQAGVPLAEDTNESIRSIGQLILGFQPRLNEFVDIVNRIALIEYSSKTWEFPWNFVNRGMLDYGETVEEFYIHMAEPYIYHIKPDGQTMDEFIKFYKPKVLSAFHTVNCQLYYPMSITEDMLQRAFLTADGISRMVSELVNAIYRASYTDQYIMIKYMLCRLALDGKIATHSVTTGATPEENAQNLRREIIALSDDFLFQKADYTMAGVPNFSAKEDQYMFVTPQINADQLLYTLATAFNLDKIEFTGHRVLIDKFGFSDWEWSRLDKIMADDSTYARFTEDELNNLEDLEGFLCDKNWFMCYTQKFKTTQDRIGMALMNQYALHDWKLYSASPFQNAVMLISGDSTVTGITYSPTALSVTAGQVATITVSDMETTGLPRTSGTWWQSAAAEFTSPQQIAVDSFDTVEILDNVLKFTAPSTAQTIYIAFVPDEIEGGGGTAAAATTWGAAHHVAVTVTAAGG